MSLNFVTYFYVSEHKQTLIDKNVHVGHLIILFYLLFSALSELILSKRN